MGIFSFLCVLLWATSVADVEAYFGVNYGRVGDNMPPPDKVVELLRSQGINRVKIFDTDAIVLDALADTGIFVLVCFPNELLSSAANSASFADNWVEANITKFYPATKIEAIAVGNEVFADPTYLTPFLYPAMKNLVASLQKFKIGNIKVSSPIAFSALETSFPPSAGAFKQELIEPVMKPILDLHRQTQSYLMVNIYPFLTYMNDPNNINLDYALFRHSPGMEDTGNGNKYSSLLVAQIDAVYAALSKLQYDDLGVVVAETGWASKGDDKETGANVENARVYNGNLVRRVLSGAGTPLRPNIPLFVIQFSLFNENKKPGPTSERNYGLFYPTGEKVYEVALNGDQLKNGPKPSINVTSKPEPPPIAKSLPVPKGPTWCVAKASAGEDKLKASLEFVCGVGGADCGPIQPGSKCFNPNSLEAHASYAFNSYYWKKGRADGSCDFNGAASVVDKPPQYGGCVFPTGSDSGTPPTSGTPSSQGQTWCVAKPNVGDDKLQVGIEFACGNGGADCSAIQPGSTCYNPNTLEAHASYAFNSYYQKQARADGTCTFGGAAQIVTTPPQYGDCKLPTGSGGGTPPSSGTPPSTGTPSSTRTPPSTGTPSATGTPPATRTPPTTGTTSPTTGDAWCVAKSNVGTDKLQEGLEYACGKGGADCNPIQPGGTCYNPNTLEAHASYAFNSYYQRNDRAAVACDFEGAASVVTEIPVFGDCKFPTGL